VRRPLGPSEHTTVLKEPEALSYVWSYETVTVVEADGAASAIEAAKTRGTAAVKNFIALDD
jgi:hypothetical protein